MCSEKHIELQQFINALKIETLVNFWSNPDELSTEALTALSQARVSHEGEGWIRANRAATADILYGIYELRKANNELNTQIAKSRRSPIFDDFNREGLGIEIDFSLPNVRVVCSLKKIIEWRGKPKFIRVDNEPEYIGGMLKP
jgi:hypothetical protein